MRGGCIFQMMTFVDDQARVRRNDCRVLPVSRDTSYRDIRHQQVMIRDDYLRLRSLSSRTEKKARLEVRTGRANAEVGLCRDLVPHLRGGRVRKIAERSVFGSAGPRGDCVDSAAVILEQCRTYELSLLEAKKAEIVPPAL